MDNNTKSRISTSIRTTTETKKNNIPPKGATIIEKNVRTETREIENGWIVSKNYDGRYIPKGGKDNDYGSYFSYSKEWYSKTNPLTITLNDKGLADAFDDEN